MLSPRRLTGRARTEGIVSKRLDSSYRSGRSRDSLKMKNPNVPAVKREAEQNWGRRRWAPPRSRVDSALVKAIARAYRWRGMLEQGAHASITELAAAEKINQSYVCRVLRLTLLAPALVEAILDGRHPSRLQLRTLLNPFPSDWTAQAHYFA
jgi:hypothetical protein